MPVCGRLRDGSVLRVRLVVDTLVLGFEVGGERGLKLFAYRNVAIRKSTTVQLPRELVSWLRMRNVFYLLSLVVV